ncbi:MAG: type II toxin-antitoxin system VapC family toxin [Gemmatimonadota bacterium]
MNFVLDASVSLAWCFHDDGGPYADAALEALRTGEAMVAPHWGLEVVNGLVVAERRGRIDAAGVAEFTRLLLALPIASDPSTRGLAFAAVHRLARTHALTSYDAAYLELAVRLGVPLVTLDGELRSAAEAEGVGFVLG